MPDLNEFLNKEVKIPVNAQRIDGEKPCSKCDLNSNEAWWDPDKMLLFWTCPDGHRNEYAVN